MNNNRKLWLIRIFLASKILFHAVLFVAVLWGGSVVKENQRWVEHTNSVLGEIEIVRNQFQTADYTARSRNLSGKAYDLAPLRREALGGIAHLKTIVSDNPKQVENVENLAAAAAARFDAQDEQFRVLTRSDAAISYPVETITRATNSIESVESLFSEIKMSEINLLRLDRAPKAFAAQWTAIYLLCAVAAASFAITVYLNVMLQRHLQRNIFISRKIDEASHSTAEKTDWKKFAAFIEGKISEYELP